MSNTQVSRITQIGIYLGKHWRLFINERGWKVLIFGAVISALVSIVLGSGMFVYTMDTFSGGFALISACIWVGIFNSIQNICKERAIIKREHRAAYIKLYRLPPYISGRHMPAAGGYIARHQ